MKLIVGLRGSGKTKTLCEMVNESAQTSKGTVICVAHGDKLNYDIKPTVRLIDGTAYDVCDADRFYGFIAGILSSNYDITHLFVDSALKFCNYDFAAFEKAVLKLESLAQDTEIVITVSCDPSDVPHTLARFL